MELMIAAMIGALFSCGVYCLLRRSLIRLIIGAMLLSQAANLIVFCSAGLVQGAPAFSDAAAGAPPPGYADPLPQALVLTAIVIGFGLAIFLLSLLLKARDAVGSDDLNAFSKTDRLSS